MDHAVRHRQALAQVLDVSQEESSEGELAAMVSYAIAFPDGFMALVDTYDVKRYFASRQILSELQFFYILLFTFIHIEQHIILFYEMLSQIWYLALAQVKLNTNLKLVVYIHECMYATYIGTKYKQYRKCTSI